MTDARAPLTEILKRRRTLLYALRERTQSQFDHGVKRPDVSWGEFDEVMDALLDSLNELGAALSRLPAPPDTTRLDEIAARLDEATTGRWLYGRHGLSVVANNDDWENFAVVAEDVGGGDGEFISHAPEDIRYLLDTVRALLDGGGPTP